jgi:hypothetical protein
MLCQLTDSKETQTRQQLFGECFGLCTKLPFLFGFFVQETIAFDGIKLSACERWINREGAK